MRTPEYLSPSSIATWIEEKDAFYLRYLAEDRPPRDPQTLPMSAGSAFDAYIKADLHAALGLAPDPAYEFEALFEAQVEPHNRDWARDMGRHIYDSYVALGARDAILEALRGSTTPPRFEFELRGEVEHLGRKVVLLGKPDLVYSRGDQIVILDWKVNGACAKTAVSPLPGYLNVRGGRTSGKPHAACEVVEVAGYKINGAKGLESANRGWARQLAVYAWLLGAPVGSDFVCGIDQLVAKPVAGKKPEIRVAEHRYRVGPMFQASLFETATQIMDAIAKDHVFTDVSFAEDKQRRAALDKMASAFDATDVRDNLFLAMTR